jgi:hypothetical protein
MKNGNTPKNQTTCRILLIACATALAMAFAVSLPQSVHADPVPSNIKVPHGNQGFLEGHAVGTQQYMSKSSPTSSAPTQMRVTCLAPRGSTPRTRALSGPRRSPPPPTPASSSRMPSPGSCLRWLEPRTDQPVATR